MYISSSGEEKDVKTLDYQYLVNALAKALRNMNETTSKKEFLKNNDNVIVLYNEILERNKIYFEKNVVEE